MNRSLAALAAGAMLIASSPLGFAQDASSSSSVSSSSTSSISSESSVSSSSSSLEKGNEWMRPCIELTGLRKAQCIVKHNPGRGNKKDRVQRRTDDKALRLSANCKDKEGMERVKCIRTHGKKGIKTMVRKAVRHEMKRTIRGKLVESSSSSTSN